MSKKNRKPRTLWKRAICEPEARKFLKQHSDEFPENSFYPDKIEFSVKRKLHNQQIAELIEAYLPFANREFQQLAKLFLTVPPREIAERLGWPRNKVYQRLRALKNYVLSKHRRDKQQLLGRRTGKLRSTAAPERTLTFTLNERQAHAFLVDGVWIDEHGLRFPQTVQDVLNELDEHAPVFEHLDVQQHG